jgi:hypothetical protein
LLYHQICVFITTLGDNRVHFSFKGFILSLALIISGALSASVFAQTAPATGQPTPQASPQATPVITAPKPGDKPRKGDKNAPPVVATAEQVAEGSLIIYGGRGGWSQVGRTRLEHGNMSITNADGSVDSAKYEKRVIRGENTDKDKRRVDEKFPSVEFALVYNTKIFGLLNDSVFTPRQDALSSFESQMYHGLDAMMRYKENESKLDLGEKQKILGVEYYVLEVTDKSGRKTRFFVSVRSLRVMMLEYTENSVKYTRKFGDYRVAQGLLVPFKTTLLADDKQIEESSISTVTFGQKVDDSYFNES